MAEQRGDMNYEDIMTLFRQENRSPQLTKVDPALYDRISAYIKSIRKESEREIAMNPSSHASMMLNDQLKKAIDKAKRVYELRTRKISLIALRKVSGDSPDTSNLTPDELVLFSSMTSVLLAHKDSNADFETLGPRLARQEEMVEVQTMKKEEPKAKAKADEPGADAESERLVMARVLEDMPTFAGVDRDYKLRKEDIVSIPKSFADTMLSHCKIKHICSS
ncbi:MAG: replication complex family protein [Candidatus Thermoplasmatota archaeon]|nr:replication complex family protein [Candidatus Thermoplasmatota archaeon]